MPASPSPEQPLPDRPRAGRDPTLSIELPSTSRIPPLGTILTADGGALCRTTTALSSNFIASLDVLDAIPSARMRRGTEYAGHWDLANRVVPPRDGPPSAS